jgi:hydroxymethylbilane synthase
MTSPLIRIGTRESQLAVWQATLVQRTLASFGYPSTLVHIKSEGDVDLKTPLYEIGVQGIFTRQLDIALLEGHVDIAVHSMKDVPTQLPAGITTSAVLARGPVNDLFVFNQDQFLQNNQSVARIATSSVRRRAQWLNRYPNHEILNLRGNVNTRLRKLATEGLDGAIFAQAGLERINLRPANSIVLDWMLPAPAQGAIMVVCREGDDLAREACANFHHEHTALCTGLERDFLRGLMGGCSTPISALATVQDNQVHFRGNIFSLDGKEKAEIEKFIPLTIALHEGNGLAKEILKNGGAEIAAGIQHAGR